jgi:hypothetical protein
VLLIRVADGWDDADNRLPSVVKRMPFVDGLDNAVDGREDECPFAVASLLRFTIFDVMSPDSPNAEG